MDPTFTSIESFDRFAEDYQETFMDYAPYLQTYDAFYAQFNTHHRSLLDIACGPGNLSRYLLTKRPELQMTGVDLSEKMLRLAQRNIPQGNFQCLDIRQIDSLTGPFDIIVCGFGLPYLSTTEIAPFFSAIRTLISAQGLLYLSTMEGEATESGWKASPAGGRYYVNYHSAAFLQAQLLHHGFMVKETLRKPFRKGALSTATDLFLFAEAP